MVKKKMSEFSVAKIKELDTYNLERIIAYNPKANVIVEYLFSGYALIEQYAFLYSQGINKKYAVILDEEMVFHDIKGKIDNREFTLLEGDLTKIAEDIKLKNMAYQLVAELKL